MYPYFQLIYRVLSCDFTTINLFSIMKSEITTQFKTAPNQNTKSRCVRLRSQELPDLGPCQNCVALIAFHNFVAFVSSGIIRLAYYGSSRQQEESHFTTTRCC